MHKWVLLLAMMTATLLAPACNRQVDAREDEKNIRQLFETYLESVKTADLTVASRVWLQSPDISVVTPLGRYKGWESVRDNLYVNFLQKAFAERNLKGENLALTVSGNTAFAVFDWRFTAKLANGQPFSSKGWESHVYQKIEGRWVIAHLHYSAPLPAQAQPQ
jgi:ketosteroid isomerase-like protein